MKNFHFSDRQERFVEDLAAEADKAIAAGNLSLAHQIIETLYQHFDWTKERGERMFDR